MVGALCVYLYRMSGLHVRSACMEPEEWSAVFAGIAVLASVVGVFIAMRANGRADTANSHAKRSAAAAEDSAAEAKRSADIAERSETRQTERNDVVWDGELTSTNFWVLTNTGEDDALEVVAVVTVDDQPYVQEAGTVSGRGGEIRFDLHEHIRNKAAKDSADTRDAAQSGIVYVPSGTLTIGERVLWVTPNGTPRTHVGGPGRVRTSGGRRR